MATIKLESASLLQLQAKMARQEAAMQRAQAIFTQAASGLDIQIAATAQIRQTLEELKRKSTAEAQQLQSMSQTLVRVDDRFTDTDRRLGREARGLKNRAGDFGAAAAAGAAAVLTPVALAGMDRQLRNGALNKLYGLDGSDTLRDGAVRVTQSKKASFLARAANRVWGYGKAVVRKGEEIVSAVKDSYKNHGWAYDVTEYGKAALKAGKAVVKIVGGVAMCATVAGIPVGLCTIISAGDNFSGSICDAAAVATDNYDKVGTFHPIKDFVKERGALAGEMLGNRELGEKIGEFAYNGLDLVSLLTSGEEMLKSFGKINTDLTNTTGYSVLWGKTSFEDVMNNKFGWSPTDIAKRLLGVDPNSTGNFITEAAENVVSLYKKTKSFVDETIDLVFH